jgi:hypothetical protein
MIFWNLKNQYYLYLILNFKTSYLCVALTNFETFNYLNIHQYTKLVRYLRVIWTTLIYFKLKYKHKIYNVKFNTTFKSFSIITKVFSHFLLINQSLFYTYKIRKLSNFNSYIFFFSNFIDYFKILNVIQTYLKWNLYTQRGFRLSRTRLKQKTGKVSAFKSFKSKIF